MPAAEFLLCQLNAFAYYVIIIFKIHFYKKQMQSSDETCFKPVLTRGFLLKSNWLIDFNGMSPI